MSTAVVDPISDTTPGEGLGLALRHRPRRFADVVGQRHVTTVLRRALAKGRLPHQLLFSGSSGLGKTTLARVVAAALLCDAPVDGDACGVCESCRDVTWPGRTHPDVVEFDAASHGGKDQIRELAARAATAPIRGKWRVYIIDEAHGLTRDGGSAFLKLLEEPPPHVIFMLATTDPDKMLRTNRGRCVEFELLRPSDAELVEHLVAVAGREGWQLSERAARSVLAATDPALGVRGALMTLEKLADALAWGDDPTDDDLATLLGVAPGSLVDELVTAIDAGDRPGALRQLDRLRERVSDEQTRKALLAWARERFVAACDAGEPTDIALWRYETVASTAPGAHFTEILVCRLAHPELDPTPAALRAHLNEASELLASLRAGVKAARAEAAKLPAAAPARSTAAADAAETGGAAAGPTGAKQEPAERGAADATAVERFTAELAAIRPAGAARTVKALFSPRSVTLSEAPDGAVVMHPQSAAIAAKLKQHSAAIRAAAERAGVSLRTTRPPAA